VESEAIPYELLVITVMIDVGEKLRNWDFVFFWLYTIVLTLLADSADNFCSCISISKPPVS
jgi:hypothetical protein